MRHTQIVSFDMDGTLTEPYVQLLLERHQAWGDTIHIVTTRLQCLEIIDDDIIEILREYSIPTENVHYTDRMPKWPILLDLEVNIHYDDDPVEIDAINKLDIETLEGILIGYIKKYE